MKEAKAGVALLKIDWVNYFSKTRSIYGGLLRKEICVFEVWEDISIALARKHLEQSSDRTEGHDTKMEAMI